MVWGSVISAAGSIAGGLIGGKSSNDAAAEQFNWQKKQQERVLKNQVKWRVDDAKRAGIHPLAAMGLSSAGPIGTSLQSAPTGSVVGDAISSLGAGVGDYMRNAEVRKIARESAQLDLENKRLQNKKLEFDVMADAAESRTRIFDAMNGGLRSRAGTGITGAGNEAVHVTRLAPHQDYLRPDWLPDGVSAADIIGLGKRTYVTTTGLPGDIQTFHGATADELEQVMGEIGQQAQGLRNAAQWMERQIERSEGRMKRMWQERLRNFNAWRRSKQIR
jgi:hypothetical protein